MYKPCPLFLYENSILQKGTKLLQYPHMKTIEQLNHHREDVPGGGKIVVIDPGATLDAEATAMLQALHSRSTEGIDGHLQVLAERGPEKFMSTYYVQYGHKSIGDCGTAIVFIEGISMLAAKAIQDSRLYNGQESSTRYIDFAAQPFHNPIGTSEGETILETWRQFYLDAVTEVKAALPTRFPRQEAEKETSYEKAIAARAFDICRGFLPAGASTNLAWSTTLRQFGDRIQELRHHPLAEVRAISSALEDALIATHPNSFNTEKKRYEQTEAYLDAARASYYYHDQDSPDLTLVHDGIDYAALGTYQELLATRPKKTELPKWLAAYGTASFAFTLDFGSFRDIQRHRAVVQRMPLLTTDLGFHEWYLDELTEPLRDRAITLLAQQADAAEHLTDDLAIRQYYLPMGYNISNYLTGDLPALTYLLELRASSLVHPTLATRATEMANLLTEQYKSLGLTLHLDPEPSRFNVKRGEADIIKKD